MVMVLFAHGGLGAVAGGYFDARVNHRLVWHTNTNYPIKFILTFHPGTGTTRTGEHYRFDRLTLPILCCVC